jgi:hypothetical protein
MIDNIGPSSLIWTWSNSVWELTKTRIRQKSKFKTHLAFIKVHGRALRCNSGAVFTTSICYWHDLQWGEMQHSSLLGLFLSFEENEGLWTRSQVFVILPPSSWMATGGNITKHQACSMIMRTLTFFHLLFWRINHGWLAQQLWFKTWYKYTYKNHISSS